MQIRVVNSRREIFRLNPDEHLVHLTLRPSNKDIFGLIETCPKIEAIQLPKSYLATVSEFMETFLKIHRIQLIGGDIEIYQEIFNELLNKGYDLNKIDLSHCFTDKKDIPAKKRGILTTMVIKK